MTDPRAAGGASPAKSSAAAASPHIDMLKALADPLRLNLLYALSRGHGHDLPAMTVKELAAELGEPQTKLYRHIKHLEAAGLISAVSSRIVSGIVEQRYSAAQSDLILGDDLTDREKNSPEAEAMAAAALELYRRQFYAARRASTEQSPATGPGSHRRVLLGIADGHVPAARAAAIREQFQELLDELVESDRDRPAESGDEDLVPVNLLVGYFSPEQATD